MTGPRCKQASNRNSERGRIGAAIAAFAFSPLLASHPSLAQNWVGDGSNSFFDAASNWDNGVVPGSGSDVINATSFSINYRQSTDSINSFTANNSGSFLMSGGTLSVSTAFTTNGSFSMTGGNLNTASFTATNSSPLTLSGGVLNISGALTTASALTLNGGTLQNATIANPNELAFSAGKSNVLDSVVLSGSSALTVNGASSATSAIVRIADTFSFTSGSTFNVGTSTGSGYLLFDSTTGNASPTFDNATVNLGGTSLSGNLGFGSGFTSNSTLTLGSGMIIQGAGIVGNTSAFTATGAGLVNNGTISANISAASLSFAGASNGNVTNNGMLQSGASGATLAIAANGTGVFTNNGTIMATNGGIVSLAGVLSPAGLGMIMASGANSTVTINSNFSLATQAVGLSETGGARINLGGTVSNSGNTFDVASIVGSGGANGLLVLNGGSIVGGTLVNANLLGFSAATSNTFDNVTLSGTGGLTINGLSTGVNGYIGISDSFSFAPGSIFNVGTNSSNSGYLVFNSTSGNPNPTFDNATINLGNASAYTINGHLGFGSGFVSGDTLTFGSGLVVQGSGVVGAVYLDPTNVSLINNGTLSATSSHGILFFEGAVNSNMTNGSTGILQANVNGATLEILPNGTGAFVNNGAVQASNGGIVDLEGKITTLGNLSVATGGIVQLNGGTISGSISPASQAALTFSNGSSNILDNVTLLGTNGLTVNGASQYSNAYVRIDDSFSFSPGATFNIGTSTGIGSIGFDSTAANPNPTLDNAVVNLGVSGSSYIRGYLGFGTGYTSANTWTLGSNLTIQGVGQIGGAGNGTTNLGANLINNGTIAANATGDGLSLVGATNGTVTNNGTIEANVSGAGVGVGASGTGAFINNGIIAASNGGTINLSGYISKLGSLSASSGGMVALDGGTITGTISSASQSALSFNPSSAKPNILDNVTLLGSSGLTINGFVTDNDSYVNIEDSFTFARGAVFTVGASGPSGGDLYFDSTAATPNPTFDNATVNLGSTSTFGVIGFGNGYASGNTLTFGSGLTIEGNGQIGAGYDPTGANLVNNGMIETGVAGHGIIIDGAQNGNITNGASGTIVAVSSSFIDIQPFGTGAFLNNGTLLTATSGSISIIGASFVNTGTVQVNSGTTQSLKSTSSTQTAGVTIVNGTLSVTNSSGNTYSLLGGNLYGTGRITGTLSNVGGLVSAGMLGASPSTGTLTISGSFVQSAAATFSSSLGGTVQSSKYDFFTVSGSAVLGGYLDVSLINGFTPTMGQSFQIIKDGSTSGTFSNTPGNFIVDDSGKYLFQVIYGANGVILTSQGMATPEPSTLMLLALTPPVGLGLLARRRRVLAAALSIS